MLRKFLYFVALGLSLILLFKLTVKKKNEQKPQVHVDENCDAIFLKNVLEKYGIKTEVVNETELRTFEDDDIVETKIVKNYDAIRQDLKAKGTRVTFWSEDDKIKISVGY